MICIVLMDRQLEGDFLLHNVGGRSADLMCLPGSYSSSVLRPSQPAFPEEWAI